MDTDTPEPPASPDLLDSSDPLAPLAPLAPLDRLIAERACERLVVEFVRTPHAVRAPRLLPAAR
ncbi:hypothetical protein [Streptomyces sp. SID14515]|uniref:hypothetical protein n=1 Tax=Streptomyces sp. SID14515 TaxID=2706074 RepID=UPI001EF1CA9F|nr:hypothetical protein [Streptomyces sp. SID14515]